MFAGRISSPGSYCGVSRCHTSCHTIGAGDARGGSVVLVHSGVVCRSLNKFVG